MRCPCWFGEYYDAREKETTAKSDPLHLVAVNPSVLSVGQPDVIQFLSGVKNLDFQALVDIEALHGRCVGCAEDGDFAGLEL